MVSLDKCIQFYIEICLQRPTPTAPGLVPYFPLRDFLTLIKIWQKVIMLKCKIKWAIVIQNNLSS